MKAKYRKKPVVVEAEQLARLAAMPPALDIDPRLEKIYMDSLLKVGLLVLEAERSGKPDIFEQTYEKVEKEDVLSVPEIYDNDGNLCNCGICKPTSEGNEV